MEYCPPALLDRPLAQYFTSIVAVVTWQELPRVYPLVGIGAGYIFVMLFNPVRLALRDGFRCIVRFPRICVTFVTFGLAYSAFQFATFSSPQAGNDVSWLQFASVTSWNWPRLIDVWRETPLPALENIAGLFDNVTTTFPLSVVAAVLIIGNWRGLHGALFKALRQRFRLAGFLIYLVLLISAVASLLKPLIYSPLTEWGRLLPEPTVLRISATIDAVAFIFEYLFGVYIQVFLITVCCAWIRGLSFEEGELFRFAVRRFSYVLKWAGIVVMVSTLVVRVPLLIGYFRDMPQWLDYLPWQRLAMCLLIITFASVQVSLVLHNESLGQAVHAHGRFLKSNPTRFGWFILVCAVHFFFSSWAATRSPGGRLPTGSCRWLSGNLCL